MSHRILRILYLIIPLGLIVAFLLRPTPILGADGESLAASTGAPVNELNSVPCTEKDDVWTCTIPAPPSDDADAGISVSDSTYEVEVDGWGCWTIGDTSGSDRPPENEGCVTMLDHISSID